MGSKIILHGPYFGRKGPSFEELFLKLGEVFHELGPLRVAMKWRQISTTSFSHTLDLDHGVNYIGLDLCSLSTCSLDVGDPIILALVHVTYP